nr:MAG TPA: hypothetical protein [Caudoviricetes sp.]
MDYILIVLLLILCVICMAMAFLMKGMYAELDIFRVENTILRLQLHWLKETDPDTFNKLIERKEIEK